MICDVPIFARLNWSKGILPLDLQRAKFEAKILKLGMDTANIYKRCGFCCDGSLFAKGRLNDDEKIDPASQISILTDEVTHERAFRQPCCYLKDNLCAVYNCRPFVCRSFKCLLMNSVNDNSLTFEKAIGVLTRHNAIILRIEDRMNSLFPNFINLSLSERISLFEKLHVNSIAPTEFRKKYGQLIPDIDSHNMFKNKYFTHTIVV